MDVGSNTAFIVFSAISPLLIAIIKQKGFSRQINALIALACYIIVGVLGALLSGQSLTLENAVSLIAVATLVGTAAYNVLWNNLGASDDAGLSVDERLTAATSIIK